MKTIRLSTNSWNRLSSLAKATVDLEYHVCSLDTIEMAVVFPCSASGSQSVEFWFDLFVGRRR